MGKCRKLVIIGLDGATWDVLTPLANKGLTPFLSSISSNGIITDLNSTFPPVTAPAWLAVATGLNPGETGAFDFLSRQDFSYSLHSVNSSYFKKRTFWDEFSRNGLKVGVFYYPMLYPAYEIDGYMISGLGSLVDKQSFYPQYLTRDFKSKFGKLIDLEIDYHNEKYKDTELFWNDVFYTLRNLFDILEYLYKKDVDVFVFIISLTDIVQHRLWKDIERIINDEELKEHDYMAKFWNELDSGLRSIFEGSLQSNNFIFISDHGFGKQDITFNLTKWLFEMGYARKGKKKRVDFALYIRDKYRNLLPNKKIKGVLNNRLKRFSPLISARDQLLGMETKIDTEKSIAYPLGNTIPFGAIYLNVIGRERNGIIPQKEYENTRKKIKSELNQFFYENDLVVKIYFPEEIYHGPYVCFAPDILFQIENGRGVVVSSGDFEILEMRPFSDRHYGSHRQNGIFLAYGPSFNVNNNHEQPLDIYDIYPLASVLVGCDISKGIDGILHDEILCKEEIKEKRHLINTIDEKEVIRKRIRKLKQIT